MSDVTLSELATSEIVPNQGGPNGWLIRVDEGDYRMVNKSGKHTLLLKNDVNIQDTANYGGIMVDFNLENDEITLHDGDNEVRVPAPRHEHVLWAVHDEDGPRLNKLFDELYTPTVRQGLMDMLMPRFRADDSSVKKTEDGWLLNGDILVGWDASNSPVSVETTHVVSGGEAVEANTEKEAREINFNISGDSEVTLPNGTTTELDDVEMRFLTTVGVIMSHSTGTDLYDDGLSESIQNSEIQGFTDTKSGLYHGHSESKHRIQDLGVTDEVADMLWSNENDHSPLHEMALREQELKNAPIDVFEDAPNDSARKWEKIHSTREKAPIPKSVRKQLKEQFQ